MTNCLKELASVRHYNMMDETHVMNEAKEAVCYVSSDFRGDLERTRKGGPSTRVDDNSENIVVDYILPDFNKLHHGVVRPHDPVVQALRTRKLALGGVGAGAAMRAGNEDTDESMTLGNERFTVPELLFRPTYIGLNQAGLPETVLQSLNSLPGGLWPAMMANVLLTGGNAKMPGLLERLYVETPFSCTYLGCHPSVRSKRLGFFRRYCTAPGPLPCKILT